MAIYTKLCLRELNSPYGDMCRNSTLSFADLDQNFIYLKGELVKSAKIENGVLILTKINDQTLEIDLSVLTESSEEALRVMSDENEEIKNNFNTDVTNINTTINEFKTDVENNSVWEWVDDRKNEVKIKGSGNTDTIVYAPKLNINIEPANDNSLTQVLVRDEEGNVKYKDIKSFTDLNVVNGVYDIKSGIVTLTNNEGGSFEISGFTSGMTDSYTDEAYLEDKTIYFNNNIKGDDIYSVDISPILDDVIAAVGYNDRGECSLKSYTEYEAYAQEYTNTKKVYDELQSNKQQLEEDISILQSQLADAQSQNPVNEDIVKQLTADIEKNEKDLKETNEQIKVIEDSGDLEFIIYMPVNEVNFNCWLRSEIIKSVGYNNRGECSYKMYALYEHLYQKSLQEQAEINKLESEKAQAQEIRNQEHANYISEKNQLVDDLANKQNELNVLKEIENPTQEELEQIAILEEQITYIESQLKELTDNEEQAVKSYTEYISFLDGQINQWYNTSLRADESGYEFFQKYTPINEANFTCWRDMYLYEIQEDEINNIITNIGYGDRGICSLDSFTEYRAIAENYTNTKKVYDELQSNKQQLEEQIAYLKSQLVNATTQEERDILNAQIQQNEKDLKQTNEQIDAIKASGDLEFVAYMPVNEVNFNCWVNAEQTDFLLNEINITNNNVTEQVEIIDKNINDVVENVGYNDRGDCSTKSYTDYQAHAENYTNTKKVYDELQSNKQQLESTIADLQSQLADAQSQVPVDEQLVDLLQENIAKNTDDLKQTNEQIDTIKASGDLEFVDFMPVNESNFNCWINNLQNIRIEEVSKSVENSNGNITNLFNSYTSTTQTTLEDFDKGIQSNSGDIKKVNELLNEHINDINNPHQTSFDNLTSTAHTHTISDITNLQTNLDDINKAVASNDENIDQLGKETAQNSKIINGHIDDTNNPHQTSFGNLTSTAHTHTISDVIGLQNDLDDINKAILSIDDIYVNQGNVDAINQKLIFTNTDGKTFEVTNAAALFTDNDIHVVSGVYDPSTGIVTYTTNVNTTFEVDGFTTGMTDTFTESASLSNNTLTFTRNNNQTYDVDLSSLQSPDNDWAVNGNNMYSLPSGNVGIGTTTPSQKLDVNGVTKSDVFAIRNGVNTRIISPQGAEFENGGTVLNGRITVTAPPVISPTSQGTQFKATIKVIEDTTAFDVHVNCYLQKNTSQIIWYHAWIDSQPNGNSDYNYEVNLYYGVDGKFNIAIGSHDDAWRYCKVVVTDVILGLSKDTIDDWATGWSITLDSNPTIQTNGTLTRRISTTQANNWGRNIDNTIEYKSGNVKILGGNSLTINNYTFPSSDGNAGQVLKTDGSGNVSWSNDNDTNTDIYTTSASLSNNTLTFTRNDNQTYSVNLSTLNSADSDWGIKGSNMYSIPSGNIGIGIDSPDTKLHLKTTSANDVLKVENPYSNLTYGGASGVGNFTNNLILKHKNIGGTDDTSSSIQLRNGGTGDTDKTSIELTTYFISGGTDISYNGLIMNSGGNKVNIISADNDAENAILSIQADESISFQSSIDAPASWPNDSKKTMTIDLTNDKVVIDGGFKLNNGTQGDGKVLISDADGNGTWGYYGLKVDYVNVKDISLDSSYNLLENTFTKVLTWETQENNTPDFILPIISSESKGSEVVVKHVGGKQTIVIVAPGVTKIDNHYSSVNITNGDSITFYCDGVNWYIKSHYKNIFGDIPGFFYSSLPIIDTNIYFASPSPGSDYITTSVHIAANAQEVYVHTTDDFTAAVYKENPGENWSVAQIEGNLWVSPTSGIDGEKISVGQNDSGGGQILFRTSGGKFGTLKVTTAK